MKNNYIVCLNPDSISPIKYKDKKGRTEMSLDSALALLKSIKKDITNPNKANCTILKESSEYFKFNGGPTMDRVDEIKIMKV